LCVRQPATIRRRNRKVNASGPARRCGSWAEAAELVALDGFRLENGLIASPRPNICKGWPRRRRSTFLTGQDATGIKDLAKCRCPTMLPPGSDHLGPGRSRPITWHGPLAPVVRRPRLPSCRINSPLRRAPGSLEAQGSADQMKRVSDACPTSHTRRCRCACREKCFGRPASQPVT
jgi:hypothetical protein